MNLPDRTPDPTTAETEAETFDQIVAQMLACAEVSLEREEPAVWVHAYANRLVAARERERAALREGVEAADEFMSHSINCIRSRFDAGRPTGDGGYEQSFAGKWYPAQPVDETPRCDCGCDATIARLRALASEQR